MKRSITTVSNQGMRVLLFLLALLLTFAGCNETAPAVETEPSIHDFSEFLNSENMDPYLSQAAMRDKAAAYLHNGKPLTDYLRGVHWDGFESGGYRAFGELFGYSAEASKTEDKIYSYYETTFYTTVALGGLTLPYDIEFGDALKIVLQKIGVEKDPYREFVCDDGSDTDMTLQTDENSSLLLQKKAAAADGSGQRYSYDLVYTETYPFTRETGNEVCIVRTIRLTFLRDGDKLGHFSMGTRALTDLRNLDYAITYVDGICYLVLDDVSSYAPTYDYEQEDLAFYFDSVQEFYNAITCGLLSRYQKEILVAFRLKEGVGIPICDVNRLYMPLVPEDVQISSLKWMGESYTVNVKNLEKLKGTVFVLTEEEFLLQCPEESKISYVLQDGNKTVRVCETVDADGIPTQIELYCSEGDLFYRASLSGLPATCTEEWLLSFGLAPYVAEPVE